MSDFTGIFISKEILDLPDLPFLHKGILAQIVALSRVDGHCHASDKYLSNVFQMPKESVNRIIKNLEQKGLLICTLNQKESNKRTIRPINKMLIAYKQNDNSLLTNCEEPINNPLITYKQIVNPIYKDESKEESKEESKVLNTKGVFEISDSEESQKEPEPPKKPKKARTQPSYTAPENWDWQAQNAFSVWLKYKTERRDFYSETGLTVLIEKLTRFPNQTIVDAVENSISNNWAGLFPEKVAMPPPQQKMTLKEKTFIALKNQLEKNGYDPNEEIHPSLAVWKS